MKWKCYFGRSGHLVETSAERVAKRFAETKLGSELPLILKLIWTSGKRNLLLLSPYFHHRCPSGSPSRSWLTCNSTGIVAARKTTSVALNMVMPNGIVLNPTVSTQWRAQHGGTLQLLDIGKTVTFPATSQESCVLAKSWWHFTI